MEYQTNTYDITNISKPTQRYNTRSKSHLINKVNEAILEKVSIRTEDLLKDIPIPENLPNIIDKDPIKQLKHCLNAVYDPISQAYLEYRQIIKTTAKDTWKKAFSKEINKLTEETKTIVFILRSKIPNNKKPTYVKINCNFRPQNEDPYQVRITVNRNIVYYDGETATPMSDITIIKTMWNSVISTPNAKYATLDIQDFHLCYDLKNYEYIFIELNLLPEDIINKYNLQDIAHNNKVYAEVQKGMYGLPQAGLIAYNDLKKHLKPFGYEPLTIIPGLWHNKMNNMKFTLVDDHFGIKYTNDKHINHLIDAIKQKYKVSIDWSGSTYVGVILK